MAKTAKKIIQILGDTRAKIDLLGLSDHEEWSSAYDYLEDVVSNLPKHAAPLLSPLSLCLASIKKLVNGEEGNSLTLVEAVTTALMAAEDYLKKKKNSDSKISAAAESLEKLLNSNSDQSVGSPEITINDVATLLIQLEADDQSGLGRLDAMLDKLTSDQSYPDTIRRYLITASEKVKALMAANKPPTLADFSEIGELIEEFMNLQAEYGDPTLEDPTVTASHEEANSHSSAGTTDREPTEPKGHKQVDDSQSHEKINQADTVQLPEDIDTELLTEFIAESNDLIARAEESLLTLETDPEDSEAVGTVFRAFHTVKGTSAFLELNLISELSHHAENLLSRVRDREIRYCGGYADVSLRALDMIKELIVSVQIALEGNPLKIPAGYDELMDILADPEAAGISEEFDEMPSPRIGDVLVAQGKAERDTVETAAASHPDEKIGVAMVKSKAATVTDVGQALRTQQRMKGNVKAVESSVRVSTSRLDRLIDMVGEMVIAHSMVAEDGVVVNGDHHELAKKVAHTSKIVRELQDISMSMRMVPLKATFNKMARLVRDLARKAGKGVQYITEGEDTEIDRNLVDIINDPLVHMVRNAVDHGIEMPEDREKAGKSSNGTIRLLAYHAAGNVVVEIIDDGRGLDRAAILSKALERGLIDEGSCLSDREVFNLIFEPGFSTAQAVTEVSGRGVGMDVVKKNIESLRGQVEIRSEPGKGSTFKMSLPLTLAIIDGMIVRVGNETYVIPTVSIIRSIKPDPAEISSVYQKGEMLLSQGKLIPLYRMADLYGIDDDEKDPNKALVVVVEDEESMAGLLVDDLVGRQQVVIKTLGSAIKDIPGISGGAILPNGRVGLILDVGGLLRLATLHYGLKEQNMTDVCDDPVLVA